MSLAVSSHIGEARIKNLARLMAEACMDMHAFNTANDAPNRDVQKQMLICRVVRDWQKWGLIVGTVGGASREFHEGKTPDQMGILRSQNGKLRKAMKGGETDLAPRYTRLWWMDGSRHVTA
jgi:hypothetical protein